MGRRRSRSDRRSTCHSYRRRLGVEPLEERRLLAVLTVTTNQDVVDLADGKLSLREAVFVANTVDGPDEIGFDFGQDGPATILLTQGALQISDSVTIHGPGAELLTIDASGNDPTPDSTLEDGVNTNDGDGSRVINVNDLAPLTLSDVSIRGVTLTGADFLGDGGAIYSAENLTIVESTISGNISTSRGAGVALTGGTLTITSSTIRENSTGGFGGGINVRYGALELSQSLIIGNRARNEGGGVDSFHSSSNVRDSTIRENFARVAGGGLNARDGSLQIASSVVEQNTSDQIGGGISNQGATLTLAESLVAANGTRIRGGGIAISSGSSTIANTTISGNRSDAVGGGIDAAGPLTIRHSTITDNVSDSDRSGNGRGGGVFFLSTSQLEFDHSIVAGNHDYSAFGADDIYKTVPATPLLTAIYTLIGNNTGSGVAESPGGGADQNGNWIGGPTNGIVDPQLGPLADNGGPTRTHALLSGSPAIDAGDPLAVAGMNGVPEFDQRGEPHLRVLDGDVAGGVQIDIGAYERQVGETYTFVVDTLADESDGDYSAGDFSLREAIELANANPGADVIEFDPALWAAGPATILLTHGYLFVQDAVTIGGPGAKLLTIDAAGSDPTPDSTLDDSISENDGDGTIAFVVNDIDYESQLTVEISGMTLTGGDSTAAGAISSSENLRLVELAIVDNSSQQAGGVYQSGGTLTVIDSVISHNNTRKHGGGIFVFGGSLLISDSVISHNVTRDDFGMGGGIAVDNSNVTSDPDDFVRIERSVISQNSAKGTFAPGGISISGGASIGNPIEVSILGSTISKNTASGNVAGIYLHGASAMIEDSTVSSNRYVAQAGVGGILNMPGGIYLASGDLTLVRSTVVDNLGRRPPFSNPLGNGIHVESGGTLYLDHSIVARNRWTAGTGNPVDIVMEFGAVTAKWSFVGAASGVVNVEGSKIGTAAAPIDPQLGPLVYNGGPVFADGTRLLTHAPVPGSPVIDAGDPAAVAGMNGVPEFDERGAPWSRVSNGDDVPEARIDMGAVEWQANPLAGDYNFNGVVDGADYSVWMDTVGSTTDLRADGSSATATGVPDGVVDEQDYVWWKVNFGNVLGVGSQESGARVGDPSGGAALARELRLAGVGEVTAVTSGEIFSTRRELGSLSVSGGPARRSSPAIVVGGARWGRAAGVDAALVAWLARRDGVALSAPGGDEFECGAAAPSETGASTQSLDDVFEELAFASLGDRA